MHLDAQRIAAEGNWSSAQSASGTCPLGCGHPAGPHWFFRTTEGPWPDYAAIGGLLLCVEADCRCTVPWGVSAERPPDADQVEEIREWVRAQHHRPGTALSTAVRWI